MARVLALGGMDTQLWRLERVVSLNRRVGDDIGGVSIACRQHDKNAPAPTALHLAENRALPIYAPNNLLHGTL